MMRSFCSFNESVVDISYPSNNKAFETPKNSPYLEPSLNKLYELLTPPFIVLIPNPILHALSLSVHRDGTNSSSLKSRYFDKLLLHNLFAIPLDEGGHISSFLKAVQWRSMLFSLRELEGASLEVQGFPKLRTSELEAILKREH
ncbi:hypothetical protein Tco_1443183 [Tanacetum coccineum]